MTNGTTCEMQDNVLNLTEQTIASEGVPIIKSLVAEKHQLVFGSAKPYLIYIADDFDEPLEDFAEYM